MLAETPKGFPSGHHSARSFKQTPKSGTQAAGMGTLSRFGVNSASQGLTTPPSASLKSRWVSFIWSLKSLMSSLAIKPLTTVPGGSCSCPHSPTYFRDKWYRCSDGTGCHLNTCRWQSNLQHKRPSNKHCTNLSQILNIGIGNSTLRLFLGMAMACVYSNSRWHVCIRTVELPGSGASAPCCPYKLAIATSLVDVSRSEAGLPQTT